MKGIDYSYYYEQEDEITASMEELPAFEGEAEQDGEISRRVAALDRFFAEVNASDEEAPEFERFNITRELVAKPPTL